MKQDPGAERLGTAALYGLDNIHVFVYVQTWLESDIVFVMIHDDYRVVSSEFAILWNYFHLTGKYQV